MPIGYAQAGLHGVVIGIGGRLLIVDVEERRGRVAARNPINVYAIAREIRGGNLRLSRLVNIAEAKQLMSIGAYITDLENGFAVYLLLKIQIEILHVRRTDIRIDPEGVAHGAGGSVDW